jgi:uncharacterized protein DUF1552
MKLNRRMVLRGAAGFTLAIPFLPSIAENAHAAPTSKRFVGIGTMHGGVWQPNMYPSDATLTQTAQYAGQQVRRGQLALDSNGGTASLSPVLTADAAKFTAALAQKMNVMRGLDVTFYLAHHRGGHLGNYAECDGNGMDGQALQLNPRPTIDQVLAWSPTFYADLGTVLERSLVIGHSGMSAGWSSPATHSGEVQNINPENNSLQLFDKIFVPPQDPTEVRPPIVDLVIEDYKRLRNGNRRLSAADKQRLDDHLERLDELQRKLEVTLACGEIQSPTQASTDEWQNPAFGIDPDAQKRFWQLINDVVAAAFACDTCRVVSMLVDDTFSTFPGDWHQDIAHQANVNAAAHTQLAEAHQRFFEDVFVDLVAKLDAIDDGNGGTVLDHSLVQWTQESGCVTHDPIEMPVITAGSAGGYFTTGNYCDYRDLGRPAAEATDGWLVGSHCGLVYNQWLGNVLQAMGLDPSEYEDGSYGGYGVVQLSTEDWYGGFGKYSSAQLGVMNDILPFIEA